MKAIKRLKATAEMAPQLNLWQKQILTALRHSSLLQQIRIRYVSGDDNQVTVIAGVSVSIGQSVQMLLRKHNVLMTIEGRSASDVYLNFLKEE